jgi:outer membrane biosynthesis protein TonB
VPVEEPPIEEPLAPEVPVEAPLPPSPEPEPEPEVVPPAPEPEPLPEPTPVPVVPVQPEPPVVTPESTPQTVVLTQDTKLEELEPETPIQLENGVILTAEVVIAIQLLENPAELLATIFTDPSQALMAISNIGADMSDEVREDSEKVVLSAIIAGGIATQAAASAAVTAAYRRKP